MHPQQNYSAPNSPNNYDFIVNPAAPPKRNPLAGGSTISRLVMAVVGLFVLLLLFVVARNLLTTDTSNLPALVRVANEQQELIHVTTEATSGQQPLSSANRNTAVTTNASLTTARSELLSYLATQHKKVDKKQLVYTNAKAVDAQLTAAASASTYDATLHQILKTQLDSYQLSLKQAYAKTTGPKGRELLNKQYDEAGLLLRQLGTN
ncbi:MAG: hypothetical protein QFB87_00465 [Patescibacteria group bacterium]|nr:hypothetical protein [Patescibacteria group bacterium]